MYAVMTDNQFGVRVHLDNGQDITSELNISSATFHTRTWDVQEIRSTSTQRFSGVTEVDIVAHPNPSSIINQHPVQIGNLNISCPVFTELEVDKVRSCPTLINNNIGED